MTLLENFLFLFLFIIIMFFFLDIISFDLYTFGLKKLVFKHILLSNTKIHLHQILPQKTKHHTLVKRNKHNGIISYEHIAF